MGSACRPATAPGSNFLYPEPEARGELTPRQREILELLVDCPPRMIGRRLGISWGTVKNHLSRLYARIGVQDRTEAVVWGIKNGVITRY